MAPKPRDYSNDDHHMTKDEYNAIKRLVRDHLQAAHDRNPFRVKPGKFSNMLAWPCAARRMAELYDAGNDVSLVRGYMIITMQKTPLTDHNSYRAIPCPMIHVTSRADGAEYDETTMNGSLAPEDAQSPILFVPSSRMHPNVSDTELLFASFALGHIWSVPIDSRACIRALRDTHCAFEKRKFCFTPEEAEAQPQIVVRIGCFAKQYFEKTTKIVVSDHVDAQIAFGFPYKQINDRSMPLVLLTQLMDGMQTDLITDPAQPWQQDRRAWVPSVRKLHEAMRAANGLKDDDDDFDTKRMAIEAAYAECEREYTHRRIRCMERGTISRE